MLRLAIQVFLFADALRPEAVAEGVKVSSDLQQSYIASAQHFQAGEDLYLKGSLEHVEAHYLYSPAFAFFRGNPFITVANPFTANVNHSRLGIHSVIYLVGKNIRAKII